jgi:hypothetical protein
MRLLWAVDFEVLRILPVLPEEVLSQRIGPVGSYATRPFSPDFLCSANVARRSSRPTKTPILNKAPVLHVRTLETYPTAVDRSTSGMQNAQHIGDHRHHHSCRRATAASDENTNWLIVPLFGCRNSALDVDFGYEDYSLSCRGDNFTRCVLHNPPLEAHTINVVRFAAANEHHGGNLPENQT